MISVALAVLTWIVADQSLTDTMTIRVKVLPVAAGSADMRVTIAQERVEPFEVRITGKKAVLNPLKAREPITVRIPITDRPSGQDELRLAEEIEQHPGELSGVAVQDVTPPLLTILVDREKSVDLPVQLGRGALDYDGPVTVEPASAKVLMSELAYAKLAPEERRILINPDEFARTARRGALVSENVPIPAVLAGMPIKVTPDVAKIRFKLKDNLQEATLSAVPIKVEASLDVFNEYNVELRDGAALLTQSITVKGRPEVLDRIRAGDLRVVGVVPLTAADRAFPGKFRYFTPRFNLPEGVELVGTPDPIEIRLVPRAAPTPTAAPVTP
jgi:hypothetical protein